METATINLLFKDSAGLVYRVKIENVRSDITAAEASILGNMFIDKDVVSVKGRTLVSYTGAELVRSEIETLEAE